MSKIWQVTANFEDWESTWVLTIGYFTDKSVAEKIRDKWDVIFDGVLEMLEEPEDWDNEFVWTDSNQYEELLEKYEFVRHLKGFQIEEYKLDQDMFLTNPNITSFMKKSLKNILTTLERDWKLKQLSE
jgi:hypothetical protein